MTWAAALLSSAWKFLRALPWQFWAVLALLVCIGLYGHEQYNAGLAEGNKNRDAVQAVFAGHLKADKDAAAKAKADAEADRQKRQAEAAAAWAVREQENADALAKQYRLVADLRAGAVRLRHEWQGCQVARNSTDGADQGSGSGDGEADLRAKGAGDLVGNGDRADAEITYLQGLIRSAPACFVVEP